MPLMAFRLLQSKSQRLYRNTSPPQLGLASCLPSSSATGPPCDYIPATLASLRDCSFFGLYYMQPLPLGYPSRYCCGSHFHHLQVSAARNSHCHRAVHTAYKSTPCRVLFSLSCSIFFPQNLLFSLLDTSLSLFLPLE